MASVTSLDADMKRLRMERYTTSAATEIRSWIEDTLHERLPPGDPLEALRDGVALCKLANLALPPPGVKYKASIMPFTQRENISQFLRACEMPPLNMPAHDRFLTVDLYDGKDPTQVIQCIGAFSRAANAANPSRFPQVIGPKRGTATPTRKIGEGGSYTASPPPSTRDRGTSNASMGSDSAFTAKSPSGPSGPSNLATTSTTRTTTPTQTSASASASSTTPLRPIGGSGTSNTSNTSTSNSNTSSWSKKSDEHYTSPAWNIHQYGYMGGASQGNQGISFGGRRQITSPNVSVPSQADKEARRKQQEMEAERAREKQAQEQAEVETRRRAEREEEEDRARLAEEARWADETRKAQEREDEDRRLQAEQERREQDELRKTKELERQQAEDEKQRRAEYEQQRQRQEDEDRQRRDAARTTTTGGHKEQASESERIRELERELREARARELQYQRDREALIHEPSRSPTKPSPLQASIPSSSSATTTTRPLPSPRLTHPFARPTRPQSPLKPDTTPNTTPGLSAPIRLTSTIIAITTTATHHSPTVIIPTTLIANAHPPTSLTK